jgi:hypothetical protein
MAADGADDGADRGGGDGAGKCSGLYMKTPCAQLGLVQSKLLSEALRELKEVEGACL